MHTITCENHTFKLLNIQNICYYNLGDSCTDLILLSDAKAAIVRISVCNLNIVRIIVLNVIFHANKTFNKAHS